jgi:hypothetical protein
VDDDAPVAPAARLTASTADTVLVGLVDVVFLLGLLPALWFVRVLSVGGLAGYYGSWFLIPFGVWVASTWSLLRTTRTTLATGSPIRQRHDGVPARYRVLALCAVVVEVGTLVGVFGPSSELVPWDLVVALDSSVDFRGFVLGAPALVAVLAVAGRVMWIRDGGRERPTPERTVASGAWR